MDKNWVWLPRASLEYQEGAMDFVRASALRLGQSTDILCLSIDCCNLCHQPTDTVVDHLIINDMDQKYKRKQSWFEHGDVKSDKPSDMGSYECEAFDLFRTAFFDGEASQPHNNDAESVQIEEGDSKEESEFRKKLEDAETPLYSSCPKYTKVSAIMALYRIKVKSGMSENYFNQLLTVVHDMLPVDNVLPRSTDEVKKFLKVFGFGYDQIHACTNDCILYRKEYKDMTSCPRCGLSRWERDKHTGEERTGIPAKVLRYFPIKDRFRRMFRSKRMAEDLVWHFNNASSDGTMRHPVDSITWSTVKDKWPQFSDEARNLRLGLCTDGMNPFSFQSSTHSTWPVLLVNYNMHPTLCLKEENIMLTFLIPGPTVPSNNIEPMYKIGCVPLGPGAAAVIVNVVTKADAYVWRPTTTIFSLGQAMGNKIAWPADKVILDYDQGTTPESHTSASSASPDKTLIIDWTSDDVIVEGGLFSTDPKQLVNNIPLGPNAAIVKVEKMLKKNAYLWRPSPEMSTIADALHQSITWPIQKIDIINQSPKRVSPLSSSPQSVSNSLDTAKSSPEKKCILLDCFNSGKTVAEGRVVSTNPEDRVHFVPLGENASKVFVLVAKIGDAKVWRPNAEVEFISDALGTTVAWPNDKVIFV